MGDKMGSANQRPANVPEENVYSRTHWMVLVTYIVAIGAVALLLQGAG
jgi:hypothetical protein